MSNIGKSIKVLPHHEFKLIICLITHTEIEIFWLSCCLMLLVYCSKLHIQMYGLSPLRCCLFEAVWMWIYISNNLSYYNLAKEPILHYAMCFSKQTATTEFQFLDENFGWLNKFQTDIHCIENLAGSWFRTSHMIP